MPQIRRYSAAAELMARFTALPGLNCSPNVELSAVVSPGEAKITRGYHLPARFVIHTVGPIWRGGKHGEAETLANCYQNALQLAVEHGIKTIAFPAISCGAYGYPIQAAARIAMNTTREFLANSDKIDKVTFVLWSEDIYDAYRKLL